MPSLFAKEIRTYIFCIYWFGLVKVIHFLFLIIWLHNTHLLWHLHLHFSDKFLHSVWLFLRHKDDRNWLLLWCKLNFINWGMNLFSYDIRTHIFRNCLCKTCDLPWNILLYRTDQDYNTSIFLDRSFLVFPHPSPMFIRAITRAKFLYLLCVSSVVVKFFFTFLAEIIYYLRYGISLCQIKWTSLAQVSW